MANLNEPSITGSFNPKPPTILHLDLNSCFATIEQQANPKLRGQPMAVAAYDTPSGCIIAPSVEAKRLGITVGMKVREGRTLCPKLIVLTPDPAKYRNVHLRLRKIIASYTDRFVPKSIDEFVLDLENTPAFQKGMEGIGLEIKRRIKEEIGEWLTISVGLAPNRFLAKTAAGLHKPDGLDTIDKNNFWQIYRKLKLTDLCGIKARNATRLNSYGIFTVTDFYQASERTLRAAFASIIGRWWSLRLHGWETDDVVWGRKSYGNSFALPKPFSQPEELAPILQKLVEKTGFRLRRAGFKTRGVHLSIVYRDFSFWHKSVSLTEAIFDSRDIYKTAFNLLLGSPYRKPVRELAVACFNLNRKGLLQTSLFEDVAKKERLVASIDQINKRWGSFVIAPARMMGAREAVIDRIAFGNVKELEEIVQTI